MTTSPRHHAGGRLRSAASLGGLTLALGSMLVLLLSSPSVAAGGGGTAADGSDWGSTGVLASDSAVTVRWDNTGNPASSVVYRDSRQRIPHTAGKTYLDVAPSLNDEYYNYFGGQNGLGGMSVTVSQTQNLVDQTVNLSIHGVLGGTNVLGGASRSYLQVFECWGGLTASGRPDPTASQPDPATCQTGAIGADTRGGSASLSEGRYVGTDPLVLNGDWQRYYQNLHGDVPFTAINGTVSGSTAELQNSYFDTTTTNELSSVNIGPDGSASRPFETQTGEEAPGLGCGVRPNVASTPTCWLVIVPRITDVMGASGPISPSLWAQRLQVKLGYRNAGATCPGNKARTLIAGSEMLGNAAASWTPGICGDRQIELGYTKIGDEVARTQFQTGLTQEILTTQPLPGGTAAIEVPLALTAPVFAYSLTYQPSCIELNPPPSTNAQAQTCGYADLADLQKDWKRAGTPVRSLNLNARLVAKLLTQSYDDALIHKSGLTASQWMLDEPGNLVSDPEFLHLNPDLVHESTSSGSPALKINHLILESLRSDAAAQVWNWILADPGARAFLDGCPDPYGHVIDPFYSTRTYVGCESQAATLAAANAAARHSTVVSPNYVDQPLSYPPDGSPFPLPTWQQYQAPGSDELPLTVVDWLPNVNSMADSGRDTAIGFLPQNGNWCDTALDLGCGPPPGKWNDLKIRQPTGNLGLMAISDAGTAARFQLATAKLCDDSGTHCVGADAGSLDKAAGEFQQSAHGGVLEAATNANYAAGAYPLTVPIYAAITPSLDVTTRRSYATAFQYLITTGQRPGYRVGDLPPGYAPLTGNLKVLAARGIATLRMATPPPGGTTGRGTGTGPSGGTLPPGGTGPGPSSVPGGLTPSGTKIKTPSAASPQVQTVGYSTVPAPSVSWAWYTMPIGFAIAMLAGLAGPLLRRRSGVKLT